MPSDSENNLYWAKVIALSRFARRITKADYASLLLHISLHAAGESRLLHNITLHFIRTFSDLQEEFSALGDGLVMRSAVVIEAA